MVLIHFVQIRSRITNAHRAGARPRAPACGLRAGPPRTAATRSSPTAPRRARAHGTLARARQAGARRPAPARVRAARPRTDRPGQRAPTSHGCEHVRMAEPEASPSEVERQLTAAAERHRELIAAVAVA